MDDQSNIAIYQSKDGSVELQVSLERETVWLNQQQMASLFGTKRQAITKHLSNIFASHELEEEQVCSILEHTASDGKKYKTKFYTLDAIISVGYRVNSSQATNFRIWATGILREHIIKGYTLNNKRLAEHGIKEHEQSFCLLQKTLLNQSLVTDIGKDALKIVTEYAKSWQVLLAYDENQLTLACSKNHLNYVLSYEVALQTISTLKMSLMDKGEASAEEKAANLLYFVIKDHPFTDGNKRIACLLFIAYLTMQQIDFGLNENGMVALALLTAESDPSQKDLLIKLITNLITNNDKP